MSRIFRIALDAMGGDFGPEVVVPAAQLSLEQYPDIELVLVGDEQRLLSEYAETFERFKGRLSCQHASEIVEMDEPPAQALKKKKDSSMRVSINLVKAKAVDAVVSAGNTGALMATAKFVLKTLPGVSRPAIIATMPSAGGHTHVLDLGANIDSPADQLYQFAVMGAALVAAVDGVKEPRIGLLNVGAEAMKGSVVVKETSQKLQSSRLNYIGFVEGNDIFSDKVDLVVCDGFVGNVLLKTTEGSAKLIGAKLKAQFTRNPLTMLAALVAKPVLRAFRNEIDPRHYNGASFIGLNGIVIKSHGGADVVSFAYAIRLARKEAEQNLLQHIGDQLVA